MFFALPPELLAAVASWLGPEAAHHCAVSRGGRDAARAYLESAECGARLAGQAIGWLDRRLSQYHGAHVPAAALCAYADNAVREFAGVPPGARFADWGLAELLRALAPFVASEPPEAPWARHALAWCSRVAARVLPASEPQLLAFLTAPPGAGGLPGLEAWPPSLALFGRWFGDLLVPFETDADLAHVLEGSHGAQWPGLMRAGLVQYLDYLYRKVGLAGPGATAVFRAWVSLFRPPEVEPSYYAGPDGPRPSLVRVLEGFDCADCRERALEAEVEQIVAAQLGVTVAALRARLRHAAVPDGEPPDGD